MSEAIPATKQTTAGLPFEQQLYERSPFGILATTAIVFALLFGAFLAVATAENIPTIRHAGSGAFFSDAAWPALVLTLLCCAALAMQRYARVAEGRDAAAYANILSGGIASALDVTSYVPRQARLGRATLIGLAVGLVISAIVRISEFREGHIIPPLTLGWFAAATSFMVILFARGVEQTRAGTQGYARMLNAELKIDLLRTDTLAVLGRSAARSALIWFVISAVACLFFVGGDLNWLTILLIAACAAMGLGHFVIVMSRIHRQIMAAKVAELEHIRRQIDAMRGRLAEDDHAGARLSGMLAYERRIQDAPEWPFDQTTAVRVGASALILTVPWFGQAIAAYVVEHLGHIGG
jgi:hypothetical protein